jgi:hypothetical protein
MCIPTLLLTFLAISFSRNILLLGEASSGTGLGEILFESGVTLVGTEWGGQNTVEVFKYFDWEVISLEESIQEWCIAFSIHEDYCNSYLEHVISHVEATTPHLLLRNNKPHQNEDILSTTATTSPSIPTFTFLNMMFMDDEEAKFWIQQWFPSVSITYMNDVDVRDGPELAPYSLDILLVNAVSNQTLIRQYIEQHKVLILIHLSDEWLGKKHLHATITQVSESCLTHHACMLLCFNDVLCDGQFYSMVPLVLREYTSQPYRSLAQPLANVIQVRSCLQYVLLSCQLCNSLLFMFFSLSLHSLSSFTILGTFPRRSMRGN